MLPIADKICRARVMNRGEDPSNVWDTMDQSTTQPNFQKRLDRAPMLLLTGR